MSSLALVFAWWKERNFKNIIFLEGLRSMIKNSIKDFYFIGENASKSVYLSMSCLPLKLIKVPRPSRFKWSLLEIFFFISLLEILSCMSVSLIHAFHPVESRAPMAYLRSRARLIVLSLSSLVQSVPRSLLLRPSLWSSGGCALLADYHHLRTRKQAAESSSRRLLAFVSAAVCKAVILYHRVLAGLVTPVILGTCS